MTRTALTLLTFAGLSVWASAQAPVPGPTAAEQLRLFQTNRPLVEDLIAHELRLSNATTTLDRADKCRDAAGALRRAMQAAADDPNADPERVAELGDDLATVVRDGLVPALAQTRREIHRGSSDYDRMKKLHLQVRDELAQLEKGLPADGKVGRSAKVQSTRQKLADAAGQIEVPE